MNHIKKIQYLLVSSVFLNVFLLALVCGFLNPFRHGETRHPPLTSIFNEVEKRLSPEDAEKFRTIINRDAPNLDAESKRLSMARRRINRAILSDPLNTQELTIAMDEWRRDWNQFTEPFNSALIEALTQISPSGRKKLMSSESEDHKSEDRHTVRVE